MNTVKYVMTNGLMADHANFKQSTLTRVVFAIQDNGDVVVTVENAHTGATLHTCGKKTITRNELRDMPENPYDDMVFNRAAFEMMGLSI